MKNEAPNYLVFSPSKILNLNFTKNRFKNERNTVNLINSFLSNKTKFNFKSELSGYREKVVKLSMTVQNCFLKNNSVILYRFDILKEESNIFEIFLRFLKKILSTNDILFKGLTLFVIKKNPVS